jgi:hypothetical protein
MNARPVKGARLNAGFFFPEGRTPTIFDRGSVEGAKCSTQGLLVQSHVASGHEIKLTMKYDLSTWLMKCSCRNTKEGFRGCEPSSRVQFQNKKQRSEKCSYRNTVEKVSPVGEFECFRSEAR